MKVNCFIKKPGGKLIQSATGTDWESLSAVVGVPTELVRLGADAGVIFDALGFSKGKEHCCEVNGKAYYGTVIFVGIIDFGTRVEITDHPAKTVREFENTTKINY